MLPEWPIKSAAKDALVLGGLLVKTWMGGIFMCFAIDEWKYLLTEQCLCFYCHALAEQFHGSIQQRLLWLLLSY
jgi:hypothetical protein